MFKNCIRKKSSNHILNPHNVMVLKQVLSQDYFCFSYLELICLEKVSFDSVLCLILTTTLQFTLGAACKVYPTLSFPNVCFCFLLSFACCKSYVPLLSPKCPFESPQLVKLIPLANLKVIFSPNLILSY